MNVKERITKNLTRSLADSRRTTLGLMQSLSDAAERERKNLKQLADLKRYVYLLEKTRAAELKKAKQEQRAACEKYLGRYIQSRNEVYEVEEMHPDPYYLGVVLSRLFVRKTPLVRTKR